MRILMWLTLGFALACAVGVWLLRGSGLLALAGISLAAAGVCALTGRKFPKLRLAAVMLLGMAAGSLWFWNFDRAVLSPARELDGQTVSVAVMADSFGWDTEFGTAVKGRAKLGGRTFRIQLYLNEKSEITPGDVIRTEARLRLTDRGGRKTPTFHRGNGIFLLAYQREEAEILEGAPSLRHLPVLMQQAGLSRLDRYLPEDVRGFAKALLLGDRTELSYAHRTDFKVTGISHVVAVSGLHLSMLFAMVYVLAGKGRFSTAAIGIPCAFFFAAMVGFTPSVTRAAVMLSLYMLSLAFNREYDPPTGLSAAVLLMLVHNPLVLSSVGFQMSVSSVAGIFLFYRSIRDWLRDIIPHQDSKYLRKPVRWFASSVAVTLSATVLSSPLAAFYFGAWSLVSVAANLLILPVISAVFAMTMGVCLTAGLPLLPAAAAWIASALIRYVLGLSHLLGQAPLAALYTASPYTVIWLVFASALVLQLIFSVNRRPLKSGILAAMGLLLCVGCAYLEPFQTGYRVTVLDVGQGQCVILQSGANTVLVDCGGDHDEDAADAAAETLLSMGISRIDAMILSHYDRDHCGGMEYLVRRIDVDRVLLPVPREETALSERVRKGLSGIETIWLREDLELSFGDSRITVLLPRGGDSDNDSSAAVLFQRGKYDTLITGDLPASGEEALLKRYALPDLEVLVVGHHGSKTSTSEWLLQECAPDVAMISAGRGNSYGHPAPQVLQRLSEAGCMILRTDTMGTITYRR